MYQPTPSYRTLNAAAWLCVALLALTQLARAATPPADNQTAFKSKADTYARNAGLPAITPGAGFEIRVWSYDYMGGSVTGTIVSKGHIRQFSKDAIFRHGKIELGPSRMSSPVPVTNTQTLKSLLDKLKPLNGATVSCPMLDGNNLLIDAVLDGRSIRISADNPWACTDKNARAVMQLMYALGDDLGNLCLSHGELAHDAPWITGFWRGTSDLDGDHESEILVFRGDGTLVLYNSDYSPEDTSFLSHYTVAGNAIHIEPVGTMDKPEPLTLHANKDRTRLELTIPGKKDSITYAYTRMAGRTCVTQQDLKVQGAH